jgi:hypothetical protein
LNPTVPLLSAPQLVELGRRTSDATECGVCAALVCPGWESMPGGFDARSLQCIGTLRVASEEEPTLDEHLPEGVHGWSAQAPIDPRYFPYNRCDVWKCTACERPFLRYTEYGGYYVDERVRELRADRVQVPALGAGHRP